MREKILFNDNWKFIKNTDNAADACSRFEDTVTLPHTWNAADGQDGGNDYYRGTCWYTKKIRKSEIADALHCGQANGSLNAREI